MSDDNTVEVDSILYRVCDFKNLQLNTFDKKSKEKLQKIIDLILNFMNRDDRFESYDYEKHKEVKRVIYVKSLRILLHVLDVYYGNKEINKIPFIDILQSFDILPDTQGKDYLSVYPEKSRRSNTKMISVGLSREQNKPHFVFKKESNFPFHYIIEVSNTFVLKKDLQNT